MDGLADVAVGGHADGLTREERMKCVFIIQKQKGATREDSHSVPLLGGNISSQHPADSSQIGKMIG